MSEMYCWQSRIASGSQAARCSQSAWPAFPGAVVALADFATEVLKHDAISTLARSNFTAPALGKGRPCSFTRRGMLGSLNDSAKHQYIGR
jgi:hypothetical protein